MAIWIATKEHALCLTDGHRKTVLDWSDVEEIQAYKVDCFVHDLICLAFRAEDHWYECSEEDHGFSELCEELGRRYPEIHEDWYGQVVQPPFASNQRVLWKK